MKNLIIKCLGLLCLLISIPVLAYTTTAPTSLRNIYRPEWIKMIRQIEKQPDRFVQINWKGMGGQSELMYEFIDWLHSTHKKVTLNINGQAISAHANIPCQANYKMELQGSLIFHSFFTRDEKTHQKQFYYDRETRNILQYCVDRGILTEYDVNQVVQHRKRVIVHSNGSKEYKPDYK